VSAEGSVGPLRVDVGETIKLEEPGPTKFANGVEPDILCTTTL